MRIVYTHDIFSRQRFGGISRYFVELIRHLSAQQSTINVLAGRHVNVYLNDLAERPELHVSYEPRRTRLGAWQRLINRIHQERTKLASAPQTVVHHTYYSFTRPLPDAALIVTVHDLIPERFPKEFGWKAPFLSAAKRRTCANATRLLVNSHVTKAELVDRYRLDPECVDVTYLGNSLKRYVNDKTPRRQPDPYVLYVGARGGYKNCLTLWKAYAQSSRIHQSVQLVCFGGGAFSPLERQLLEKLNVASRVLHVQGDDEMLANYYQHAQAFVYPSRYEGFGIPLVEAMSFGCPIACSTAGAIPEIAGPAGAYFDPDDPEMLANVLETVLYDSSYRIKLQQEMRAREPLFRWEETARQTLLAYEKAVA